MPNAKMKCPECGFEFSADPSLINTECPSCKKQLNIDKAIKYLSSLNRIKLEEIKVAEGEAYAKLNAVLDEAEWLIKNGEFESALEVTDNALKISNTESRIYLLRVLAKTENFENLKDESHYSDLKKAIELSPYFEKERIKKLYAPYYRKKRIPDEERQEYENQEAEARLKTTEEILKDGIPKHFAREKFIKWAKFLVVALAVLSVSITVLSVILSNVILSAIGGTLFVLFIGFLAKYFNDSKKAKLFNAGLDIFDAFSNFNLTSEFKLKTVKDLEEFAISALEGQNPSRNELLLAEVVADLLNSKCPVAENFINDNLTLIKIKENLE